MYVYELVESKLSTVRLSIQFQLGEFMNSFNIN